MTEAPVEGHIERPTTDYTLSNNAVVSAHTVTEETEGEVGIVGGVHKAVVGEVLMATNRPNTWDVYTQDAWTELGATEVVIENDDDFMEDEPVIVASEPFNPTAHTAVEVRAFLARTDVSEEEKGRVRQAEVNGLNRSSALS